MDGGGGPSGEPRHLPPLQRQEEPAAPAPLQVGAVAISSALIDRFDKFFFFVPVH